jgi:hypothetical protein
MNNRVKQAMLVQLQRATELLQTVQQTLTRPQSHGQLFDHDPPDHDHGGPGHSANPGSAGHDPDKYQAAVDQAAQSGQAEQAVREARDRAVDLYNSTHQDDNAQVAQDSLKSDTSIKEATRAMIDALKQHTDGANVIVHEETHTDHAGRTTDFKVEIGCHVDISSRTVDRCEVSVKGDF